MSLITGSRKIARRVAGRDRILDALVAQVPNRVHRLLLAWV